MASLLISATRKSSGKTSVGIGLAALLRSRGNEVQTFKKGPDYIDSMWLSRASQRPCINLDFYTMTRDEIEHVYDKYRADMGVVIVEGNKGLFDGMDVRGSDCNAALAKLLDLPILLLVDASGITRGIAPLLHGYKTFDQDIHIAGVVLNKVAGDRHERKLRDAIAHYTDIEVLGAIHRSKEMEIEERHIGLVPSNEDRIAQRRVQGIAGVISQSVDVDKILALTADRLPIPSRQPASLEAPTSSGISIGVAKDEVFGFYYPDDFQTITRLEGKIKYFDTLRDVALPNVDALFIGGGFPEFYLSELEQNVELKKDIRKFIEDGKPVYAECGGLMYLCSDITFDGKTGSMVGAIRANVKMQARPVGRGYVQLQETSKHPWPKVADQPENLPVHEFHYSNVENLGDNVEFAYKVVRGVGIKKGFDGLVYKNTLATYTHHRNVGCNRWVERFIKHIANCKNKPENNRKVAV